MRIEKIPPHQDDQCLAKQLANVRMRRGKQVVRGKGRSRGREKEQDGTIGQGIDRIVKREREEESRRLTQRLQEIQREREVEERRAEGERLCQREQERSQRGTQNCSNGNVTAMDQIIARAVAMAMGNAVSSTTFQQHEERVSAELQGFRDSMTRIQASLDQLNNSSGSAPGDLASSRNKQGTSGLFPYLTEEIVELVKKDQLKIDQFAKLRNPECSVAKAAQSDPPLKLGKGSSGQPIYIEEDTSELKSSAFTRSISNIVAFAQVWTAYVTIRALYIENKDLIAAYVAFLNRLIEIDMVYDWEKGTSKYILAVCRKRFGVATADEWYSDDQAAFNSYLNPNVKSTQYASSSKQKSYQASSSSSSNPAALYPCKRYNLEEPHINCTRPHICSKCQGAHPRLQCTSATSSSATNSSTPAAPKAFYKTKGTGANA